jgi:hypothetical protein
MNTFCTLLAILTLVISTDTAPSAAELRDRMMKYRQDIKQGHVEVEVTWLKDAQTQYSGATGRFRFDFKPDSLRNDISIKGQKFNVDQRRVATHQTVINYEADRPEDSPSTYRERENSKIEGMYFMFRPTRIGIEPCGIYTLSEKGFDSDTLYAGVASGFVVVADSLDGVNTWKVSYRVEKANIDAHYWIAPEQGYGLLRYESHQLRDDGGTTDFEFWTKPQQYGKSKIWYTSEYYFRISQNSVAQYEEKGKTITADLDIVPSDATFTLSGLDLPIGTQFVVDGNKKPHVKYWNGKELSDYVGLSMKPQEVSKNRWAILFAINAIILGILSYLFWKHYTKKPR